MLLKSLSQLKQWFDILNVGEKTLIRKSKHNSKQHQDMMMMSTISHTNDIEEHSLSSFLAE